MSQNKQNKIQIKYENAINYKPNPDSDYFVSDLLQKPFRSYESFNLVVRFG